MEERSSDRKCETNGLRRAAQEAAALASCFWCERLHPGAHPLSVCLACTAGFSTMRSLEMSGSYPLSDAAIDQTLKRTSPGTLGYMDGETFSVFYVGRSDSDLKRACTTPSEGKRPRRYTAHGAFAPEIWASDRFGMPTGG